MYQSTVEKFIKAVGEDEYLPCSSVMSAENLKLLSVVERKASKWAFGKDKYYSTEFTLSDVTKPTISKSSIQTQPIRSMVEFKKMAKLDVNGKLEGHFKQMFGAELDNSDKIYVNAPVGDVNIVEVEQQSLLDALKTGKLNMGHELVKELTAKPRRALCVVVGVLSTASECTLTASLDIDVTADVKGGVVSAGGEISSGIDSNRSGELKLPAGTVLAYQAMELSVDKIGSMHLMVSHDARGGFKKCTFDDVDGTTASLEETILPEFKLQSDALFAPLSALSPEEKRLLVDDLKVISNDQDLLTELYRALKLKKFTNKAVQSFLKVAEAESVRFSMLALVRALVDLSPNAQHQVMCFLTDSGSLVQVIEILSSTYFGKPMRIKKPIPEHISDLLIEGLDYDVKEVNGQVEVHTERGVYSSDARSAYVALDGLCHLQQGTVGS